MSAPLRVLLVGPWPPPSGGMANQTRQLQRLLEAEGVQVTTVATNAPYRPAWIANLRGLRAVFRLVPYAARLFRRLADADVVHVMANSGWAWHLFAMPAIRMARLRRRPVVVNYRGGLAREFLAEAGRSVRRTMSLADALVVPSRFLQEVFATHSMTAVVVPNIVDVEIFNPGPVSTTPEEGRSLHIVVARNLEHLYGNDLAIEALALVREQLPAATMTIAGSGPELGVLRDLVVARGLQDAVCFAGRLETDDMVRLYRGADVVLNPTRADNTPNSVLEALACGVPVVSTNVGGVPYLVDHARSAWLVPPECPGALAEGIVRVARDGVLRQRLVANGLALARSCSWPVVREQWLGLYRRVAGFEVPAQSRTVALR